MSTGSGAPDDRAAAAYAALERRIAEWALGRPDVDGAVVVGSRARTDRPADRFSDLDVLLLAHDPDVYLARADWLAELGRPLLTFLERTAVGGWRERRVLFEDGLELDVSVAPLDALDRPEELPAEVLAVPARGYRVLLDRRGRLAALADLVPPPPRTPRPSPEELLALVHDFLYHALWAARKLARGERWVAKHTIDGGLKQQLLRVAEWQAAVTRGPAHDTWHAGRFLADWADPRLAAALPATFARWDDEDMRRALDATIDLFGLLARETAQAVGAEYPAHAEARVRSLIAAS